MISQSGDKFDKSRSGQIYVLKKDYAMPCEPKKEGGQSQKKVFVIGLITYLWVKFQF